MPTPSIPPRFFGIALAPLRRQLASAWAALRSAPLLASLDPMLPVRLFEADGALSLWLVREGAARKIASGDGAAERRARFVAIEAPGALLLRRQLTLPPLAHAALQQALSLEARSSSPFAADDLVWGYTVQTPKTGAAQAAKAMPTLQVDLALASRKQIDDYLIQAQQRLPAKSAQPELWALAPGRPPVVLRGFGEALRHGMLARLRFIACALLVLAIGLAIMLAATPTLQLRSRAIEAVMSFDALYRRAAPLLREREALLQTQAQLAALQGVLAEHVDPLRVIELLTQALPDDSTVFGLQIQGSKLSMNGQTGNAAALMQRLSAHPLLHEVRAPSAATRPPGASKDSFTIELSLDTKALALAPSPPAAPPAMPTEPPTARAQP